MFKQINVTPAGLTGQAKTDSEKPTQPSTPVSPQMRRAKRAVSRLLKFYPPLDVGNPEVFIAGIVSIFAQYPTELMAAAVDPRGIPRRLKNLTNLAAIEEVCRDLYAPIARQMERDRIANAPRALPRPKRTPEEQAKIDAQVAAARRPLGEEPQE